MIRAFSCPKANANGLAVKSLEGRICLVTGASRGIGRGIALGLGEQGATVYVTGRTQKDIEKTSEEVTLRGGRGIPVVVDHSKIEEIKKLFDRIKSEQTELHLLVNNCYSAAGIVYYRSFNHYSNE